MHALEEVRTEILDALPVLEARPMALAAALGLVLAEPVAAVESVPPFANTAMDGYAVRAADTAGASDDAPVRLKVIGDLAAGHAPTVTVGEGQAVRIMTGAPIPPGADAIVMVERTERAGRHGVLVRAAAEPGDHIRGVGGDVAAGQKVFRAGTILTPARLGVLASFGLAHVRAYPRARVGVLSTGDELHDGPGALAPGQIRDSNRPMLLALLRDAGCTATDFGIVRDDEKLVMRLFDQALETCDAVITSGGVSVGDYDVVKAVLEKLGVLHWWQIAIKPAKPLAFALLRGAPVFGLPGNPVSSHVSFELFARPALLHMMGHRELHRPRVTAIATAPMARKPDGKVHFDRVRVRYDDGCYFAERAGAQASNALAAMATANGLAVLPDGEGAGEGDSVEVILLDRAES